MTQEEIKNEIAALRITLNQNRADDKGFMLVLFRIIALKKQLDQTNPEEVNETLKMESNFHIWWSVEIKNNEVIIQPEKQRLRHGALGRVIIPRCTKEFANKIKQENEKNIL